MSSLRSMLDKSVSWVYVSFPSGETERGIVEQRERTREREHAEFDGEHAFPSPSSLTRIFRPLQQQQKKKNSHDYSVAVFSKNRITPFTRAERIVRAATRASPAWGPALSELRTISLLCEAPSTAAEVSGVLARRLDPPPAAWRRAAKALAVVEHLATSGGPGSVKVAFARANLLGDLAARFQSYDETGRDVGEGVRTSAARLAALMRDPAALEEARAFARMVRERARGSGSGGFGGGGGGDFPRLPEPERVLALPAPAAARGPDVRPAAAAAPAVASSSAAAAAAAADPAHLPPTPAPSPPPQAQPQAQPLPDLLSFDDDDSCGGGGESAAAAAAIPLSSSSSASPASVLPQGPPPAAAAAAPSSLSTSTGLPPAAFAAPAAIIAAPPVFSWHPVKLSSAAAAPKPVTPAEALEQMLRDSVETFDGQAVAAGNGGVISGGGDGRRTSPRPPPMSSAVPIS